MRTTIATVTKTATDIMIARYLESSPDEDEELELVFTLSR